MGGSQQRMSGPMRYAGWVVAVSVCVILAFSDAGAPRKEASQEPITQDDHDMEVYNEWKAENAGAPDGLLSDSNTQNQGDDYSAWLASEGAVLASEGPVERRATDAYIRSFRRSGSGSGSGSGSSTKAPTKAPTNAPSKAPTKAPTGTPSNAPTKSPTKAPTAPTKAPTNAPTFAPSKAPTGTPSNAPSFAPTVEPVQAVQEVDVVMPYASANDFVKDVKRVTVVKKGYGKSIGVMKDACTTCLPPPTARPTTCTTTCVLKAGRRSGLYEPYWVLKDGVGIDMKVKQSNRRASVSLAITFTTTIVGATNVDTAAVMAGVTDPAALVANINAVTEAEKAYATATNSTAYGDVAVMPASAVAAIKPPAPPPSAESFMAAQAGSAEDEDGAPVAVIVIGALIVSGCMMGWPIYCLIYKKDNDKEKDIQETVLISNAPGSKTDPGAGGFEI